MEFGGKLEANANDKVEVTGCRWYYGMPQWFLLQVARVISFFFSKQLGGSGKNSNSLAMAKTVRFSTFTSTR